MLVSLDGKMYPLYTNTEDPEWNQTTETLIDNLLNARSPIEADNAWATWYAALRNKES